MGTVALACRVLLIVVFTTASVGKLMDLEASRRSVVGFGIRPGAARVVGTALPFVELAVALLLVFRPTAQVGAALALALLCLFIAGIANALRQGKTPDCNCFGALQSAPAGWNTIGRNVGLAAVAVVALVWGPGPAIDDWVAGRSGAVIVAIALSFVAAVVSAAAFWIWRRNRELSTELDAVRELTAGTPPGLHIGVVAPDFDVPADDGGRLTLAGLLEKDKPVVLVFAFPGCGVCAASLPDFLHWAPALEGRMTFGFVGWTTMQRAAEFEATRLNGEAYPADLDEEMNSLLEVLTNYRIRGTPSAVMVSPGGFIASSTVDGRPAIEALIRVALTRSGRAPSPGETALETELAPGG